MAPTKEPDVARASIGASTLNLINNVVGAGLFSMPWCLKESTLITGCGLLAVVALLNAFSFMLLARCCELGDSYSYLTMGRLALGHRFGQLAQLCVCIYATGSCISYVVLTGDFLVGENTGVFQTWANNTILYGQPGSRVFVLSMVAILVFFPLCCLRNIEPLKYSSFISLVATIYAGFLTIYTYFAAPDGAMTPEEQGKSVAVDLIGFPTTVFAAVPIVNVAFTAHYNAPRYYQELHRRSTSRFSTVVILSTIFVLVIYGSTALCGYLTFGDMTSGDILKNFNSKFQMAIVARLALSFVVIFTFPLANHCVRESLINMLWNEEYNSNTLPWKFFLPLTVAIITFCTIIGCFATKIEDVLAYKGAIFGTCIVYLFPPLMFVRLKSRAKALGAISSDSNPFEAGRSLLGRPDSVRAAAKNLQEEFSHPASDKLKARPSVALRLLFTLPNTKCALLFFWGVVTGVLGVVISVIHQTQHS